MKKRILSVVISLALIVASLTSITTVVKAETMEFNVTATNVSGWTSTDPYTRRAKKSLDGDTKFYVKAYSMSGACYYVNFYMNRYINSNNYVDYTTYSTPLCYLRSSVGEVRSQSYSGAAPGGYYYFMECVPYYGYNNITVTGRFTP